MNKTVELSYDGDGLRDFDDSCWPFFVCGQVCGDPGVFSARVSFYVPLGLICFVG